MTGGSLEIPSRENVNVLNDPGWRWLMLLIGLEAGQPEERADLFHRVVEALSVIKSDIDILGWFEGQAMMGLIVPDIEADEPGVNL